MNYCIGLLSGTSVDGIDAAIVGIDKNHTRLICTHEQEFSEKLKSDLQSIIKSQSVDLSMLSDTDALLGFEFSQAVMTLLKKSNIAQDEIMAIGSHGQTIFHQPNGKYRNTIQIGSAHIIAANTGITVVSNFRNLDMAYGGQGAPLAPLIHQQLFNNPKQNTAIVNLGGIANISFIGKDYPQPVGFDTGPANCLMDEWILKHKQRPFDEDGQWAKQGKLNSDLLNLMLEDDYFKKPAPKSTGREYFNQHWLESYINQFENITAVDLQTTLCHLTAASIAQAITNEAILTNAIIIMGGGANNCYLKSLIHQYSGLPVTTANEHGYDSDWVEAILFAYLAYKRVNNQQLDLSSFTGSSKQILLGDITQS